MYLKMENQKYLLGLKQATITQLELPVRNTDRTLLVDAFITTENTYMGLLKSFLIHDEERTWLKSGFQFFAIHRPDFRGTGRDMVIQVDPQLHVHLQDLWDRLEKLERTRVQNMEHIDAFWVHPDRDYFCLSSPIRNHGSSLQWSEIVSLIWELYNPAKSITVNPYQVDGMITDSCRIYECQPILSESRTLPTLQRYLAACASNNDQTTIPPIHPLPQLDSFDFIEIPAGFALIHHQGVFILDDWNNEPLDFSLYKQEVQNLLERAQTFDGIHTECIEMMSKVMGHLRKSQTLSSSQMLEVTHWITTKKTTIRHTILKTMLSSSDYYLQSFREKIEKRWAIQTQLNELYETITELENILESHVSLRTNRLITLITIFGFPFALFSGLFEIIFDKLPSPPWLGINWTALLLFFILSLVSTLGLHRYIKISANPLLSQKNEPTKKD
jgi:hypothetical protein